MTSNITDAIKQLNRSINSLSDAVPAVYDTIKEKERQIGDLQKEYFKTHPEAISGSWEMDISSDNTYEHARLMGWSYDNEYWESVGDANGNKLAATVRSPDEEHPLTIALPNNYEKPSGNTYAPSVSICFYAGDIEINFYHFNEADFFHFLKEHNILVKTPIIDEKIDGFNSSLQELKDIKSSIVAAGVTEAPAKPTFVNCVAWDTPPRELLIHTPLHDDPEPIGEDEGIQFNAEQVANLHKHIGVSYDTLTDILTWIRTLAGGVNFETLVRALELHQTELDQISVEIGDLDTKDEPLDAGMAGSVYWNMLQAVMYQLDGTVTYIEAQDIPLFAEVHHRLKKLVGILEHCNIEFEKTYLGGNYDNE